MYEIVPFIVDLPMKIVSRIFHSYLSFPEGVMSHDVTAESGSGCLQFPLQALNVRVLSLLFLPAEPGQIWAETPELRLLGENR